MSRTLSRVSQKTRFYGWNRAERSNKFCCKTKRCKKKGGALEFCSGSIRASLRDPSLSNGLEQHLIKLIAGGGVKLLETGLVPVRQNLLLVGLHHMLQFR